MSGLANFDVDARGIAAERDEQASPADGRNTPRSLTRAVFEALRADILACRLVPGAKLPIAQLAQHYQVSLSAVRESLSRLAAEGWVKATEQRGFRVAEMSAKDLDDLTIARCEIGALVLRLSIERGDAAWESRICAAHDALQRAAPPPPQTRSSCEAWRAAHWAFHLALVSACGSGRLLAFYTSLHEQAERYRVISGTLDSERRRDVTFEHRRLLEAALRHDAAAAVDILQEHFAITATIVRTADDF